MESRFDSVARAGGTLLPLAAAAAFALILVPIPAWLADLLLTGSLAGSLWLLILALGAPGRDGLGFLPNYLVLNTLFRLTLNLATTRLILSRWDAGRVIAAFGHFVAGGSFVVGAWGFGIITVGRFVGISWGATRFAQVTARFSLDGLPGRQRAIATELEAGVIDAAEARRRRATLERESYLYGGLDGAMRFVQGDAIAGLVITCVNLLGGVLVGTSAGLDRAEALVLFGTLTIGDGLAAQIPALLTATAAGLVVTRVAGADPGERVGVELTRQVLARPGHLALVAVVLTGLAATPGLPAAPMLVVSLVLAGLAVVGWRVAPGPGEEQIAPARVPRLALSLATDLPTGGPRGLPGLDALVQELADRLGIPVPVPRVRRDPELGAGRFRVLLDGAPVYEGLVSDPGAAGRGLRMAVERVVLENAGELLGISETRALLDSLGEVSPELVRSTVPHRVEVATLAAVLRGLLAGGIPVTDLRGVLEAIAACREQEPGPLLERVRVARRRQLSRAMADATGVIRVYTVSGLVEDALREAARLGKPRGTLRLDRDLLGDLRDALVSCAPAKGLDPRPVLFCSPDVRPILEASLAGRARVVTGRELDPDLPVEHLGVFGPT